MQKNQNKTIHVLYVYLHSESAAEFVVPLKPQQVKEMDTATFDCELSKPNLKVKWLKGTEEIFPSEKYEMATIGAKYMLTVRNATTSDAADYTIIIEDGVQSTASLQVEGTKAVIRRGTNMVAWYIKQHVCLI